MDNRLLMRRVDGPRQYRHQSRGGPRRQRRASHEAVESLAWHELARQKRTSILLADFENLNDIGVSQAGHRFGLGTKPRQVVGTAKFSVPHPLQGDDPP